MRRLTTFLLTVTLAAANAFPSGASDWPAEIERKLEVAGGNRTHLETALQEVPKEQTRGMQFLIRHMPDRDARSLTADFLLRNVDLAYKSLAEVPWGKRIPEEVFFNDVLPYASINESRDDWRQRFHDRFLPVVRESKSPAEAAAKLNQTVFPQLKVKYSTRRRRADQGPFESMQSGLASCTGLSILLIDACRSVGVPARFVGTPLWSDGSGNHSWVEVWDDGWHFTGAAEPTGDVLDQAWFIGRASGAVADDPRHAIYAVSYRKTPLRFPLVWDRSIDYVHAVNVTHRYVTIAKPLPEGHVRARFVADLGPATDRVAADVVVTNSAGEVVFEGETRDERFDSNDHVTAILPHGHDFEAVFSSSSKSARQQFHLDQDGQLIRASLQ